MGKTNKMNTNKIKEIQNKAKAENRNLTDAEVKQIKALTAEMETASVPPKTDKGGTVKDAPKKSTGNQKPKKSKKVKVKLLLPVAGKFHLSANVGETVAYPKALATELVDAKYAELA